MIKRVGVISLGCAKNLVDTEIMLGLLRDNGYEITSDKEICEAIIINTCGFIESSQQEAIDTILEMALLKERNCKYIIVTGCLAQRYKDELIKEIPEIDAVLGTSNYDEIVDVINKLHSKEKLVLCHEKNDLTYLNKERFLTSKEGYGYLKIAEGCNNCCTYCVIPSLRGKYRSRDIDDLVKEAKYLADNNIKELILIAQDTTQYGIDLYGKKSLVELIRRLSEIEKVEAIRLLYCYPEEINDDLIQEMKMNKKLLNYIDIPIQHSSDKILKLMGRRGNSEDIKNVIKALREKVPEIAIRTSLIVGFPGEDEEDFKNLVEFVEDIKFDKLGVFIYSKEEGTPSAKMKMQVKSKIKKQRYRQLMETQAKIHIEKNYKRVGSIYRILVEGIADDGIFYYGRSYMEAPEIDNLIYFVSDCPLNIGEFVNVKVLTVQDYDLIGEVYHEVESTQ